MAADDLIIDLSNYKDRMGSRVTPGTYHVIVEDAEAAESQAKNPMVNLWFRIVGTTFDGQTVTDRLVLTDKSLFRVVGFMGAIGLPTPKKKLRVNLNQFKGKHLMIDVSDGDPYNGRVRSEVRGYSRIDTGSGAVGGAAEAEDEFAGLEEFSAAPDTSNSVEDLPEPESEPSAPAAEQAQVDEDGSVDLENLDL